MEARFSPSRILVAGASGAGKTTLARWLAQQFELPYLEIDSCFHGPEWKPRAAFLADVDAFSRQPSWVTEWQYDSARELLASRATTLVLLDLPRATVMRRVTVRTIRRRVRREELWNGNREAPLHTILHDPEHVIRWSWATYPRIAPLVDAAQRRHAQLDVIRLRTPREVRAWKRRVARNGVLSAGGQLVDE